MKDRDFGQEEKIANAARNAAGEAVQFCTNHPIVETFRGKVVWEGIVSEYMTLKRQHVYAWAVESERQGSPYIAFLQSQPILTPLDAARAWIVSEANTPQALHS